MTPSWSSLAARAAALIDQPFRQVSDPRTPEATAAINALTEAIVADGVVTRRVAEFGVTKWLIERNVDSGRRQIEDCVREVDEEQR